MSELIVWDTPFKSEFFPSVWISANGLLKDTVVSVGFPAKWEIRFQNIVALKVCDESYDMNERFHVEGNTGSCAYIWENSPWFKEFRTGDAEAVEGGKVKHYVFAGGDYNVEILALGEVKITVVDKQ